MFHVKQCFSKLIFCSTWNISLSGYNLKPYADN